VQSKLVTFAANASVLEIVAIVLLVRYVKDSTSSSGLRRFMLLVVSPV
jgi:hypothetical protein